MTKAERGFSLVELSIVLVILGLLTGGILAGQSLIRSSELRALSTEYSRYISAANIFRDKYFALPGDMANATSFWGGADANPTFNATCQAISTGSLPANSGTATCNGNGDGIIHTVGSSYSETFRYWQHLANAGLIEGNYTGYTDNADATTMILTPNINVPKSKLSNGLWGARYVGTIPSGNVSYYADNYGNAFGFGGSGGTGLPDGPILKPEEAWNLDTKMDDGKPAFGIIKSLIHRPECTTTVVQNTAEYALTNSNKDCALIIKIP